MFNKKGDYLGECYPCTADNKKVVKEKPEQYLLVTALWFPKDHSHLFWAIDCGFDKTLLDNYITNIEVKQQE
jgi:hypothetical protein